MARAGSTEYDVEARDRFSRTLDRASRGFSKLQADVVTANAAFQLGAAGAQLFSGALDTLYNDAAGVIDRQAKVAAAIQTTTEYLQAAQYAAGLNGVETEALSKAYVKQADAIGEAADGVATYQRAFDKLGLDAQVLKGQSVEEQYRSISEAFADVANQSERVQIARTIFGRQGAYLIRQTAEQIDDAREQLDKFGIRLNAIDAANIEFANDSIYRLGQVTAGARGELAQGLAPAITTVAGAVFDAVQGNVDFEQSSIRAGRAAVFAFGKAGNAVELVVGIQASLAAGATLVNRQLAKLGSTLGIEGAEEQVREMNEAVETLSALAKRSFKFEFDDRLDTRFDKAIADAQAYSDALAETRRLASTVEQDDGGVSDKAFEKARDANARAVSSLQGRLAEEEQALADSYAERIAIADEYERRNTGVARDALELRLAADADYQERLLTLRQKAARDAPTLRPPVSDDDGVLAAQLAADTAALSEAYQARLALIERYEGDAAGVEERSTLARRRLVETFEADRAAILARREAVVATDDGAAAAEAANAAALERLERGHARRLAAVARFEQAAAGTEERALLARRRILDDFEAARAAIIARRDTAVAADPVDAGATRAAAAAELAALEQGNAQRLEALERFGAEAAATEADALAARVRLVERYEAERAAVLARRDTQVAAVPADASQVQAAAAAELQVIEQAHAARLVELERFGARATETEQGALDARIALIEQHEAARAAILARRPTETAERPVDDGAREAALAAADAELEALEAGHAQRLAAIERFEGAAGERSREGAEQRVAAAQEYASRFADAQLRLGGDDRAAERAERQVAALREQLDAEVAIVAAALARRLELIDEYEAAAAGRGGEATEQRIAAEAEGIQRIATLRREAAEEEARIRDAEATRVQGVTDQVSALQERLRTEREAIQAEYDERIELLREFEALKTSTAEEAALLRVDIERDRTQQVADLEEREAQAAAARERRKQAQVVGYLERGLALAAGKSKTAFQLAKAYDVAKAVNAGRVAAVEAYKWGAAFGGPAAGAIAAGLAVAATGAYIADIAGQSFGGGGTVGGLGGGGGGTAGGGSSDGGARLDAVSQGEPTQVTNITQNIIAGDPSLVDRERFRQYVTEDVADASAANELIVDPLTGRVRRNSEES